MTDKAVEEALACPCNCSDSSCDCKKVLAAEVLRLRKIAGDQKVAIEAAVDVIPRWTETERVPNPTGTQLRCVFCKGHNAGECGVNHTDTCIVGRALRLCRAALARPEVRELGE